MSRIAQSRKQTSLNVCRMSEKGMDVQKGRPSRLTHATSREPLGAHDRAETALPGLLWGKTVAWVFFIVSIHA